MSGTGLEINILMDTIKRQIYEWTFKMRSSKKPSCPVMNGYDVLERNGDGCEKELTDHSIANSVAMYPILGLTKWGSVISVAAGLIRKWDPIVVVVTKRMELELNFFTSAAIRIVPLAWLKSFWWNYESGLIIIIGRGKLIN